MAVMEAQQWCEKMENKEELATICAKRNWIGAPVADIAASVHLSTGTVRNHLSSAIGKTSTTTRAEAARVARDNGWI